MKFTFQSHIFIFLFFSTTRCALIQTSTLSAINVCVDWLANNNVRHFKMYVLVIYTYYIMLKNTFNFL